EVDARDRELARGLLWLLHDPLDALIAVELRDAEVTQVLAVGLMRQDDASAPVLLHKGVDAVTDRALENVVGEKDHAAVVAYELLRQAQRFGDPARLVLVGVRQALD